MTEINNFIEEFRSHYDPNSIVYKRQRGEFGFITVIMYNPKTDLYYYLHYRRYWFDTFGKQFGRIPAQDRNSRGTSIPMYQLREAHERRLAWIVICKANEDATRTWYYCPAKDWYEYVTDYETYFTKDKSKIDSILEACIPLRLLNNMDDLNKTKEKIGLDSWT